ncbi:MAG: Glutathione S-transferase domain [Caulobacter sp.]|nr:Glutathione S-transferase domain [Caulobacter sp.]
MVKLRHFHVAESRSMRTLWLLNELGIPFEGVEMPWDLKHLRSPDYLAVNPLGRVPAIIDEDARPLFESLAITQVLCWKHSPDGLGRRPGHAEWPEWLQWLQFSETMAVHAACLVQQKFFIAPESQSSAVANLESRRLVKALEVIDRRLADREYLLEGGFSAADVAVGYSIHMGKLFFEPKGLVNVLDYYERLSARPAFQASLPAPSAAAEG